MSVTFRQTQDNLNHERLCRLLAVAEGLLGDFPERRAGGNWWVADFSRMPVDEARQLMAADLAGERANWEPVRKLLEDGSRLAREQR
jgi:hypothetical protein